MGRPRGAKNRQYLLPGGTFGSRKLAVALGTGVVQMPHQPPVVLPDRLDKDVLAEIMERYDVYGMLLDALILGDIRALMVAGAPGIGKSFLAKQKLHDAKTFGDTRYHIVSGGISPVNLYKLSYKMRHAGNVIVLDDSDEVMREDEGISVLKAICDSGEVRTVSWLKESAALVDEQGNEIPREHNFEGSIAFITNWDIQRLVDEGRHRLAPHLGAIQSRSLYLDLLIHNRHELGVWVNHIAETSGIFEKENILPEDATKIMTYLNTNRAKLHSLDLRTVVKACDLMKAAHRISASRVDPVTFEYVANTTLLRRMPV